MRNVETARIHLSLPAAFLKIVDDAAHASYMSRAEYIRLALLEKIGGYNLDGSTVRDKNVNPDEEWQKILDSLYGR